MKKIALIFITIFSYVLSPLTFANTANSMNNTTYSYNYNSGEKFTFVESGITFSVFRNGEFDFYINRRNGIPTSVDIGLVSISYNSGYNYDAYVQYDDYGAIIQIENIPIYYDHYGRIVRAGNININYRSNRLVGIGGLHIYYNPYGYYSHYSGFINSYNRYYAYHPYHNYFVRPYYNRCVVSYDPYRLYYKPARYNYYNYRKSYSKNHNKNRTYKRIDSRVRTADNGRSYQKRSTNDSRLTKSNNTVRSLNLQRSLNSKSDRNSRTKSYDKKQVPKRNMQSQRNRVSSSEFRVAQNVKKEGAKTSLRRTVGSRNTPEKSVKQYKTAQRSRANNIKHEIKRVPERNKTQRTSLRSESYKQTKVQNSIRKKNLHPRNKRTVAGRTSTRKSL